MSSFVHAYQSISISLAHPPRQRLLPVPLHGAPVDRVDVPGGPIHHSLALSLAMLGVVLVALVTSLALLEFVVYGFSSLLAHHCQPPAEPVQQRLQVAGHHVQLPGD